MAKDGRARSRVGWWRAGVLLLVHLLIAIHIAHWLQAGSTLSPLEPSEAMEVSTKGIVNAGLIFFVLTIVSTLVLGRWFCGWACHVVALQDASRWLLLKVGIRPRPLRSRLLLVVPLLAAIYMFVWPWVWRALNDSWIAPFLKLDKADFWETFPTWPVALLTFAVCGFFAVLFLGSKGFCTYGCPYGAIFVLADRVAPFRIRVNDDCNACGKCTSTCTSNVLVHAEVRDYGMVVDPGCMKCMDCVSVCPNDALRFGPGKPALFAKPRVERPQRAKPAFNWREELGLGCAFVVSFFSLYGLYDLVPFLLALGLAGLLAHLWMLTWRTMRRPSQKLLRWHLKKGGRTTALGRAFLSLMATVALVTLHSGAVRGLDVRADRSHQATEDIHKGPQPWAMQLLSPATLSAEQKELVNHALVQAQRLDRLALVESGPNAMRQAWLHLLLGDNAAAERHVRRAIALLPGNGRLRLDYARFLDARGRPAEAVPEFRAAIELDPEGAAPARHGLGKVLVGLKQFDAADQVYGDLLATSPVSAQLWAEGAAVAAMREDYPVAAERFRGALERDPTSVPVRRSLLEVLLGAGETAELITMCTEVLKVAPADPQAHRLLGLAHQKDGDQKLAERHLRRALMTERHPDALEGLARILAQRGEAAEAAKLRAEAHR